MTKRRSIYNVLALAILLVLICMDPVICVAQDPPSDQEPKAEREATAEPEAPSEVQSESAVAEDTPGEPAEGEVTPQPAPAPTVTPWPDRVEALSKKILLGQAERTDADALIEEIGPQLRTARNRLREALATGESMEVLKQQHSEMEALYDARILLLQEASPPYQLQVMGMGPNGVREAQKELDRLQLHMRYQGRRFPDHARTMGADLRTSPIPALKGLAGLLIAIILFRAWRRWADTALPAARQKVLNARPRTRRNIKVAKTLWYLERLRTPVEWLVLLTVVATVLKPADSFQDEDPARLIIKWIFVGWAGLRLVDAIAARGGAGMARDTTGLRLRSLKLIWGWIAAFGLARDLAVDYVGRGTLHNWVWWIFVFLGIPVLLILILWWRDQVFERLAREPDLPASLQRLLAKNREKKGYVATALGGAFLLLRGLRRRIIRIFSNFEIGRRIQAHFFRREVERQAQLRDGREAGGPLPEHLGQRVLEVQGLVSKVYRKELRSIVAQAETEHGWVIAIVGERGRGKSTLLGRVADEIGDSMWVVNCPTNGFTDLYAGLREQLGLATGVDGGYEELAEALHARGITVLALDNAHRLTKPKIGGFADWSRLRELVHQLGANVSLIYTFDQIAFQYLLRARADGAMTVRVLQLAPWTEEEISELLQVRAEAAGIEPDYDQLILPRQLDEMVYEVEGDRQRHGFTRILWDSSQGNPAVALRMWRDSMVVTDSDTIEVRLLPQRGVADLDDLGLTSQFVLRSIAQMEYAELEDIVAALNLPRPDVEAALNAALARGLIEDCDGPFHLTWSWYRTITRLLNRQNLLAMNEPTEVG
jgi:Cdc6-like AAA superfamily ATPase